MPWQTLRGISRVMAALSGVLLVYGIEYSFEEMTPRIPHNQLYELALNALYMLPWTILFCSGMEDLGTGIRQAWVFWTGVILTLAFLYYFEHFTSSSALTKVAMPLLATAGAVVPHLVRPIKIVFTAISFAAGIAGVVVLYLVSKMFLSGSSFVTRGIGIVILAFIGASLAAGILSVKGQSVGSSV
jgi:hypothetical protein